MPVPSTRPPPANARRWSRIGTVLSAPLEMIIGLLGILKAGGAYLPLDPLIPTERLVFMLQDARASVILTQQHS